MKNTHSRVIRCQHHTSCNQELSGGNDVHDSVNGSLSPADDCRHVALRDVVSRRCSKIQEMRDDVGRAAALSIARGIQLLGWGQGCTHEQHECLYAPFQRSGSRRSVFSIPTT